MPVSHRICSQIPEKRNIWANPTVDVLERGVAALDGASGAIAFASGMAAITNTLFNVAEGGGRILTSPALYG